jgi:hypothetical protein
MPAGPCWNATLTFRTTSSNRRLISAMLGSVSVSSSCSADQRSLSAFPIALMAISALKVSLNPLLAVSTAFLVASDHSMALSSRAANAPVVARI